ncbi:MAG TPA: sigma-E processing peptidase SpoIIGA [Candidatus Borkfalkia faecipullorum]|uniref:Sigma-E processing peptidase SpoIIGA n=1 Tax=Candidatus Borkfalkia faecipullorum TaxID=2838510 RepID=A0A9D2AFL4_9FIRM|nr:sigma-E processing peptidase SpoIIGA [Candidatus Borkfalkia faecipullorum]
MDGRRCDVVVYLDLLILDNFCADAALLWLAVRTVRGKCVLPRILLSALLGTALGVGYTVLCLYCTFPAAADFFLKYAVALLLPLTAAHFEKKRSYAYCSLAFVGYMFAFAGALTALCGQSTGAQGSTLVYTVYGIPSGALVAGCVCFVFLGEKLVRALLAHTKVLSCTLECVLHQGEKELRLRGFADTGNRLRDGRGKPVVVAERAAVLQLCGDFYGCKTEKIAVKTVNGSSEFFAVRIDLLEIYFQEKRHTIEDVTVAVSPSPLSGEYSLILPASFAEEKNFQARG